MALNKRRHRRGRDEVVADLYHMLGEMEGVASPCCPQDAAVHALQCASLAVEEGAGAELVAAALVHGFGHHAGLRAAAPLAPPEVVGARWARERLGLEVAWLVMAQAPAKLYLLGPSGRAGREGETGWELSLEHLVAHPRWGDALRLCRWDEEAKAPRARTSSLPEVLGELAPLLASLPATVGDPAVLPGVA